MSNHLYFGVVSGTLRRYNTGVHRKEPLTAAVVAPACCQRKLSVCPVFDWWWQKTKLNNAAAAAAVRRDDDGDRSRQAAVISLWTYYVRVSVGLCRLPSASRPINYINV